MKEVLVSLVILCLSLSLSADPVCTFPDLACYQGSVKETDQGRKYLSFQGIRFAQPPTGDLRFKLPVKYEAKDELYDVSGTSDIKCMQFSWDGENVEGTEDCLFLNVYVPGGIFYCIVSRWNIVYILNFLEKFIESEERAPVLFWIYGGALVVGSNTYEEYGPNLFMDQDIIVVAVNYRLSAFGFLSTTSEDIPGNTDERK